MRDWGSGLIRGSKKDWTRAKWGEGLGHVRAERLREVRSSSRLDIGLEEETGPKDRIVNPAFLYILDWGEYSRP